VKFIRSIPNLRSWVHQAKRRGKKIGFVPTMGALHEGHLSLIHLARKEVGKSGKIVVSIFINPTQFNQKSDLLKYPKPLAKDLAMCRKAGTDVVFAPSANAIYPPDFSTWVEEKSLSLHLCGASRPGHFRGVCTIVLKLFNQVQPDLAIFGQKDAQQAHVVCRMVRDLNIPVRVIIAPIIREREGLAMSSRNQRLNPIERKHSAAIYRTLAGTRQIFRRVKQKNVALLRKHALKQLKQIPGLRMDYVQIVNPSTLQSVQRASPGDLLAVAVFLGKTRLIDNVCL
jgi:pantoate--beta-alanine ligase